MKIIGIHIFGYGKLENKIIHPLDNTHVFYGENEAGKSTIMSFIHSILFGFPTKQQTELRYEPKKQMKYGGQLELLFPDKGKVVVERVKGKATGDVTVTMGDGTRGGEELLKELLQQMDKSLFQAIFSFNLQGLQNIHQMRSEDLGRYLFSTGAVGSDLLYKVDNDLQKTLESKFKPNGKKPLINGKVQYLHKLYGDLKKAQHENDQYNHLLTQKEYNQKQLKKLKDNSLHIQYELNLLSEWEKIQPLYTEEKIVREKVRALEKVNFPEDGIDRLERILEILKPLQIQKQSIQSRIAAIQDDQEKNNPNYELLEKETEITLAIEKIPLYEQFNHQYIQTKQKKQSVKEEMDLLKDQIHIPFTDSFLLSCDTSVFMRENTLNAQTKEKRLREKKLELDEIFAKEKEALEETELLIGQAEKEILTDDQRQDMIDKHTRLKDPMSIKQQISEIQNRKTKVENKLNLERKKKKREQVQWIFFSFMFFFLFCWGVIEQQMILMSLVGSSLLFTIFSLLRSYRSIEQDILNREWKELRAQEHEFLQQQKNVEGIDFYDTKNILEFDDRKREQLQILKMKWDQQNEQYDKVIKSFELWENEFMQHKQELLKLGEALHLPNEISLHYIHDAFQIIERLKSKLFDHKNLSQQLEIMELEKNRIKSEIEEFSKLFLNDYSLSLSEIAYALKKKLQEESEKRFQFKENHKRIEELEVELKKLDIQLNNLMNEVNNLYVLADVQDEEEFRKKAKLALKKNQYKDRLENLHLQLELSFISNEKMKELDEIYSIEKRVKDLLQEKDMGVQEIDHLHEQLAEINYKLSLIEEGGTYSELLHKFKQLKFELEEESKEWARFSIARDVLSKTIERYKSDLLPKMLIKAEEFLAYLTEGKYIRIMPKKEGAGFLVESHDHLYFDANELSQATTEQLYVSLRLSLALTLYQKYKWPIVIDDSFVNFDYKRTERIIKLLRTFTENQLFFFTCHKHLIEFFNQDEIIEIN